MSSPGARPELRVAPDGEALADAVARALADRILAAAAGFTLVLAGGRTPRGIYQRLAADLRLDWSRVTLVFGDERALPPTDPASNFRMVEDALLSRIASQPTVLRIAGELGAEAAARDYDPVVSDLTFDLVLLGMGEDGHVASIFPDTPDTPPAAGAVIATTSPLPPPARVSLTLERLAATRALWLLVTGVAKAETLAAVWGGAALPAARIGELVQPGCDFRWYLDASAASRLPAPESTPLILKDSVP